MAIVERLLRWLEVPINLLLWVALIAGFLMMMHVGADVTGRTRSTARCRAPPRSSPAGTWWRSASCRGLGSSARQPYRGRHIRAYGDALSISGSKSSSRSSRRLRRVSPGRPGCGRCGRRAPARCGRRPAASSRVAEPLGASLSAGLDGVYLVLRSSAMSCAILPEPAADAREEGLSTLTLSLGSLGLILLLIALRVPIGVAMGAVAFWASGTCATSMSP